MLGFLAHSAVDYTYTYNDVTSTGQLDSGTTAAVFGVLVLVSLICLALSLLMIIGMWRTFTKAGRPGWAAIVPIYNIIVLLQVAGQPEWWILLLFIPFVNIIVYAMVCVELARRFGKGTAFGLLLLFLFNGLGFIVLGFGSATYQGPTTPQLDQPAAPPSPPTPAQPSVS